MLCFARRGNNLKIELLIFNYVRLVFTVRHNQKDLKPPVSPVTIDNVQVENLPCSKMKQMTDE